MRRWRRLVFPVCCLIALGMLIVLSPGANTVSGTGRASASVFPGPGVVVPGRPASSQARWTWLNPLPTNANLHLVFFVDSTTGWIVGGGALYKTEDGGTTWKIKPTGTSSSLSSVFFTSALRGWAVGANGTALRTIDGGETWTASSGIANNLNAVFFIDENTGWTAGSNGPILKTTDGGST